MKCLGEKKGLQVSLYWSHKREGKVATQLGHRIRKMVVTYWKMISFNGNNY